MKAKPTPSRREQERAKLRGVMDQAQRLDRRRQAQIANQRESINRLLQPDHGYSEEMAILHEAAAEAVARVQELEQELKALRGAVSEQGASAG